MPARNDPGSKLATRLAAIRHWRGATQTELAEKVGMSVDSYRRLELGQVENPPLRTLVNCAKALGVPFDGLVEPKWRAWWDPFGTLPEPPRGGFWPKPPPAARGRERPEWLKPPLDED